MSESWHDVFHPRWEGDEEKTFDENVKIKVLQLHNQIPSNYCHQHRFLLTNISL